MDKEFICKGCGEKFDKDMQSSNVGYCYICNEFYMKKHIADLEAKLAESEKDRLMWQEMYKNADRQNKSICETDIYPLQEENAQLKQQLAEKEKEIEKLKQSKLVEDFGDAVLNLAIGNKSKLDLWHLIEQHAEKEMILEERIRELKQDKISFAVEQLNQAKGKIQHNIIFIYRDDYLDVIEQIDNQIEQLKEKKYDRKSTL